MFQKNFDLMEFDPLSQIPKVYLLITLKQYQKKLSEDSRCFD